MNKTATRDEAFKHFTVKTKPLVDLYGSTVEEFAYDIISAAKQKGLTYDQAYAGLEYAFETMQYESQFLSMK